MSRRNSNVPVRLPFLGLPSRNSTWDEDEDSDDDVLNASEDTGKHSKHSNSSSVHPGNFPRPFRPANHTTPNLRVTKHTIKTPGKGSDVGSCTQESRKASTDINVSINSNKENELDSYNNSSIQELLQANPTRYPQNQQHSVHAKPPLPIHKVHTSRLQAKEPSGRQSHQMTQGAAEETPTGVKQEYHHPHPKHSSNLPEEQQHQRKLTLNQPREYAHQPHPQPQPQHHEQAAQKMQARQQELRQAKLQQEKLSRHHQELQHRQSVHQQQVPTQDHYSAHQNELRDSSQQHEARPAQQKASSQTEPRVMEKSKNFPVLREEKVSRKNPPIIDASRWMVIPDRDQEKWFLKLSLLGRGGFSEVYKVQSMEDNEVYALKAVSYTHEGEGLLANEIKILQKLKGLPWIVELKDFFLDKASQMCYILLELGTLDLSQVIKGILKEEDLNSHRINCRKLWLDMVMAVKTIHDNNIVHSDLKPANFLMVGAHLKLIDFGISTKLQDDSTSVLKDTRCGTFNYMAPEMLQTTSTNGEVYKVGRYSDVWSMGCILYLMLYGHTPFQHISLPMQKFLAIVNPDHVIEYPSHPNKQAVHVIELCLQRNPKLRPTVENLLHHPFISGDMLQ